MDVGGWRGVKWRGLGEEGMQGGTMFQTNPEGTKWDYRFPAAWGVVSCYQRGASGATSSSSSSYWSVEGLHFCPLLKKVTTNEKLQDSGTSIRFIIRLALNLQSQ